MCSSLKGNADALFNFAPGKVVGGLRRYDPIGVVPLKSGLSKPDYVNKFARSDKKAPADFSRGLFTIGEQQGDYSP